MMASFDALLEKLGKTYAEIARLELELASEQPSPLGVAQLTSVKRMAAQLETEWKAFARVKLYEVCRYRVIDRRSTTFSVSPLSRSISHFQDLFSQIYDALKNGPRERARITPDVELESNLKLAYTFPGSFGFVLIAEAEPGLFDSPFEDAASALIEIMSSSDEFDIRDLSKELGQAVVKRTYEWSRANSNAGYGLDLQWVGPHYGQKTKTIEADQFAKLVDIIEGTKDRKETIIEARGILLGMDTKTRRFRFHAQPSGDDYSGLTSEEFDLSHDWIVNHSYVARISSVSETRYSTLETKISYTLLSLRDAQEV